MQGDRNNCYGMCMKCDFFFVFQHFWICSSEMLVISFIVISDGFWCTRHSHFLCEATSLLLSSNTPRWLVVNGWVSGRDNFERSIGKFEKDVHWFHWAGRSHSKGKIAEEPWMKLHSVYEVYWKEGKKAGYRTELSRRWNQESLLCSKRALPATVMPGCSLLQGKTWRGVYC